MDDMNSFERLIASEVVSEMGPSRSVDASAVFAAAVPAQSPKWRFGSMFSATKFVVAGAIVALFGGFLLAGVLTQRSQDAGPVAGASMSPTATARPIELPAEIPDAIDTGTLDTPLGQARWVHLVGDETTIPVGLDGVAATPDGYVVPEWGSTPAKLWRSSDLIIWDSEPLDFQARYGDLVRDDGAYWLSTSDPGSLWRSPDAESWQQLDLDRLARPGPDGHVWSL